MSKRLIPSLGIGLMLLVCVDVAVAQSWNERVEAVKRKRAQASAQEMTDDHPAVKMRQVIPAVDFDQTSLRHAIEWWKETVGVAMLVDWNALELQGVDTGMPISVKLRNAPASVVLDIILELASQEFKLYHYETKWYVQILTRDQILKKTVTRMYDVRDLLVQIPNYRNRVPKMGLSEALSNTASVGGSSNGGGSSSSSVSLFSDSNSDRGDDRERPTQKDQAQELIDLIQNTIEPDIWIANGGYHSSVTFFNGMLVVKAPEFVQRQISSPTGSLITSYRAVNEGGALTSTGSTSYTTGKAVKSTGIPTASSKSKVSAVQTDSASSSVSGVGAGR